MINPMILEWMKTKARMARRAAALEKRLPELRTIRKRNGVGRPPFNGGWDIGSRGTQADHVNEMARKAKCYAHTMAS